MATVWVDRPAALIQFNRILACRHTGCPSRALTAGYIKYWVAAVSVRTQCRRELAQHSVVVCAQIWNDDTNSVLRGAPDRHLRAPLRGSHQFFTKGRVIPVAVVGLPSPSRASPRHQAQGHPESPGATHLAEASSPDRPRVFDSITRKKSRSAGERCSTSTRTMD